ncbi:hypothetical protein HZC30_07575 [Candidatus Woesearchaeota archaeon]|nr:hypothetical protein [Candidatus Woesearchaeota archaeon]
MNITINGFGRIGRQIFRQLFEKGVIITSINDPNLSIEQMRILLSYDTIYGRFPHSVEIKKGKLIINNRMELNCYFEKELSQLNLTGTDYLIDSSGKNRTKKEYDEIILKHPKLKRIIVTTFSTEADQTIIYGVNEERIDESNKIISTSTCDAVAILPIIKHIKEKRIESVTIITLHPYLSNQKLLDGSYMPIEDISLIAEWRAAPESLIPKKTSVESICIHYFPELKGKVNAYQMRIPTPCVSCAFIDISFNDLITEQWVDSIIQVLKKYYLISSDHLISKDFMNDKNSGIIDLRRLIIENKALRMLVWYDNESGYSSKVLDILEILSKKWHTN